VTRRAGFTLIEVLVVMVVVALVAGIAGPRLSAALPGASVRGAGRTLASQMRYLYAYAVSQRQHVRLAMNLDDGTYWAETFVPDVQETGEGRVLALQLGVDFSAREIKTREIVKDVEKLRTAQSEGVRSLPKGVEFGAVEVAGGYAQEGGMAYIEFSPWGYGDDAAVELRRGDEHRTVRLRGLIGEAVVNAEEE